jgi:hypothetical protein
MTEPYRPRIGDRVEVYQTAKGRPEKYADRLIGEVSGIGIGIRKGYCRVEVASQWGYVHNWYLFSQVREV